MCFWCNIKLTINLSSVVLWGRNFVRFKFTTQSSKEKLLIELKSDSNVDLIKIFQLKSLILSSTWRFDDHLLSMLREY